ncbi:MAG TPA: hypothetical protein VMS17_16715, partial [Gemmataceae bacterium]|nr:hypothetical protein [Gemmataceae bacterium]
NLHGNRIGEVGARDFAASSLLDGLRQVDLSGNAIGAAAREALQSSPLGQSGRCVLDLSNNVAPGDE